jgi:predicted nucleotidyltransferase
LRKTLAEPREGDLLESVENIIFDVKGLIHLPNKVIAFPRFIPDPKGSRIRNGVKYSKVYGISERFDFLEKTLPKYVVYDPVFGETLCEVPLENVKKVYTPVSRLKMLRNRENLNTLEEATLQCLGILREKAGVPWNKIGVSGSLLVGLHTATSDIDPVVYGMENCRKVHAALRKLLEEDDTLFKPYNLEDLRKLFDFRSKDTYMSYKDFVKVESRKAFQGKFMDRDYFIRFVKDWNEIEEKYGDVTYRNCGYAKIEATVVDDADAIFTPCTYKIEDVKVVEGPKLQPIKEIASFRGRFCEQARKSENVTAQGKLEYVKDHRRDCEYFRLLLGNKPTDYMILKH